MRGLIIYDKNVAANREWYIGKYIECFKKHDIECRLAYTDEIGNIGDVDFAIMRDINPAVSVMLEKKGIRVFNSSQVSAICNDKYSTYKWIECYRLAPFLPMMSINEYYEDSVTSSRIAFPCVVKSRNGHGGTEVFWVSDETELEAILVDKDSDNYIIQNACNNPGIDVRVYIIGGEIVAAMKRMGSSTGDISARFKSNYCLGGTCEQYDILSDKEMISAVEKITNKMSLDFAGIDFIFHNGKPVFNEIEDVVGARMLYDHTDIDIVERYVEYIVRKMKG
ncbi:MAG: ATP-grasp domain-containing protein [Lachnospiraceae bacterium]|nr:ATP-grasp domain-containing protein [Candidatus Colinaster scatohippi]